MAKDNGFIDSLRRRNSGVNPRIQQSIHDEPEPSFSKLSDEEINDRKEHLNRIRKLYDGVFKNIEQAIEIMEVASKNIDTLQKESRTDRINRSIHLGRRIGIEMLKITISRTLGMLRSSFRIRNNSVSGFEILETEIMNPQINH